MNKITNFKNNPFIHAVEKFFSARIVAPFSTIGAPVKYSINGLTMKSISPKRYKGRKFKRP